MKLKYPRTLHLPWSPGATHDDKVARSLDGFEGQEVVVTEKLDGENTTMYRDAIHARSLDGRHHASRNWVKRFHASIAYRIPEGWRCCGENLFARHSIAYENLSSYFYLFNAWNADNDCIDWDATLEFADTLGCPTPTELYRGKFDERTIRAIEIQTESVEGYVVRTTCGFPFAQFSSHVAKWVRPNHVQTDDHWMHSNWEPNRLREDPDD